MRWAASVAVGLACFGVALAVAARVTPLGWHEQVITLSPSIVLLALAAAFALPLSPSRVARAADADLGTRDRIATTLELVQCTSTNVLEKAQVRETLAAMPGWPASGAAPMRVPTRRLALAVGLAVVTAILLVVQNPMDELVARRNSEASAISEEAREIKKRAQQVARSDLPAGEKRVLVEELENTAERLEKSESLNEALEELARTDSRLEALQRSDSLAAKALMSSLDRELEAEPLADGLEGDLASQLGELSEIESELADSERAEAASRLGKMAESLRGADSELAQSLERAASALQRGEAESELAEAAREAGAAQSRVRSQEAASGARASVQGSRERLANRQASGSQDGEESQTRQSGQTSSSDQNSSGATSPGSGREASQQGSGSQPGSTGSEGRSGEGTGGREGGTGRSDVAETRVYDPIFGVKGSEDLNLEGELGTGPQTTIGKTTGPRTQGEVLVPLRSVYPAWSSRAARTVDTMPIRASLRVLIRSYFEALNPDSSR